ncbi:amino acid ABC transporter, permease protein [Streptococcus suis YB51]|nr:amino acid ABC transporter, permease protein [Streptococcus suis YB51]
MDINWQAVFNADIAREAIPQILEGLPYTLSLSLIGFALGTFCGFFVAFMRMSKFGPLRWLAMAHISLMRGIPLMVLLFFIYFGLPFMGLQLDAISASIIAFTSMSSAYISEIIRASLSAIDKGQWEAARSLRLADQCDLQKNHYSPSLSHCPSTAEQCPLETWSKVPL